MLHTQSVLASLPEGETELIGQKAHFSLPILVLYVPGRHAEHISPRLVWPTLHLHELEELLPESEFEFKGQSEHELEVVAPDAVEYLPTSHVVQGSDPDKALYLPASQLKHGPPSLPVKPAMHLQSVIDSLCSSAWLQDGQVAHSALPVEYLYWPEGQPESQMQSLSLQLPPMEMEFCGHGVHAPSDTEPTSVLYFPEGQSTQETLLFRVLNFPARHTTHM